MYIRPLVLCILVWSAPIQAAPYSFQNPLHNGGSDKTTARNRYEAMTPREKRALRERRTPQRFELEANEEEYDDEAPLTRRELEEILDARLPGKKPSPVVEPKEDITPSFFGSVGGLGPIGTNRSLPDEP